MTIFLLQIWSQYPINFPPKYPASRLFFNPNIPYPENPNQPLMFQCLIYKFASTCTSLIMFCTNVWV